MTIDREGLKRWYREAMHRRLQELRDLRPALLARDASACDAARAVGQALRGSGATYGYPQLSAVAGLVESSPDGAVHRRVEGLIEHLYRLAATDGDELATRVEWLRLAAGGQDSSGEPDAFPDLATAWDRVSAAHRVEPAELSRRVAELFHLEAADLSAPSRAALRLVPEALIRSKRVLPLREDSETITVATADPTSLEMEAELQRLTGRRPVFVVISPTELERGIVDTLGGDVPELRQAEARPSGAGAPAGRPDPGPTAAHEHDGTERVLVVDDDPGALLLARGMLHKGGYEVEEAGDGAEALERLRTDGGVALVVADLNMPRLDGLELIWEMRARDDWSRIPVIVVTGETDEILETKLIEEGADDYIRKPLDPRLFLARVAATIRRAEH